MTRQALLLFLLVVALCTHSARAQSRGTLLDDRTSGAYQIQVWSAPAPAIGPVHLLLDVKRSAMPAQNLKINLVMTMPSMPGMRYPPHFFKETSPGVYESDADFSMGGAWSLVFTVEGEAGSTMLGLPLTVSQNAAPELPAPASPTPAQGLQIRLRTDGTALHVGTVTLTADVTSPDGRPVTDATVWMAVRMDGMYASVAPRLAKPVGGGAYALPVKLTMNGRWRLTVQAESPQQDNVQKTFDLYVVPAAPAPHWLLLLPVGLGVVLAGALRRRSFVYLAGCVAVLVGAAGAGMLLQRAWPVDRSMGMQMNMAEPDAGMHAADLAAPVPVQLETIAIKPLRGIVQATGVLQAAPGHQSSVAVAVPEQDLPRILPGASVELSSLAWGSFHTNGTVSRVSETVDAVTHTGTVLCDVPDSGGPMRVGNSVDVDIVAEQRPSAISIPASAVFEYEGRASVWVVLHRAGQTVAVPRYVQVGLRTASRDEVLSGLVAGDRIVIDGGETLQPGAAVAEATWSGGVLRPGNGHMGGTAPAPEDQVILPSPSVR